MLSMLSITWLGVVREDANGKLRSSNAHAWTSEYEAPRPGDRALCGHLFRGGALEGEYDLNRPRCRRCDALARTRALASEAP